jgi:hypothetical protein
VNCYRRTAIEISDRCGQPNCDVPGRSLIVAPSQEDGVVPSTQRRPSSGAGRRKQGKEYGDQSLLPCLLAANELNENEATRRRNTKQSLQGCVEYEAKYGRLINRPCLPRSMEYEAIKQSLVHDLPMGLFFQLSIVTS